MPHLPLIKYIIIIMIAWLFGEKKLKNRVYIHPRICGPLVLLCPALETYDVVRTIYLNKIIFLLIHMAKR